MNIDDIRRAIPHRDPFLWIDSVAEITETRIVASRHLTADLPVFAGHYPDFPVFPGVLQCEACFQAGAVLIASLLGSTDGKIPVVTRQNNTQFRRLVRPGDTLQVDVELTERLANAFFLKGRATVDGKVTARLDFACALAPRE